MTVELILAEADLTEFTVRPLGGGTYNAVYRVTSPEGDFVLKVSPSDQPGLTYERNLMRTEALFCRLGHEVAPVPEVVHTDFSRTLVPGDALLTTCLPGQPLFGRTDVDRASVRRQLGKAVAGLHEVTGPGFGYPQLGLHTSWTSAFFAMVDAVRADAVRFGVDLPDISLDPRVFDEVKRPSLVHFDLWDGNVLTDTGLTGLVDGERAFWGDPVAEFVSLALFGSIEDDGDFLGSYGFEFTDSARIRLASYQAYLYSIMLVERVPRGSSDPAMERLVTDALRRALDVLP
ncbi:aminoglycoside phosphotransferase family protein [Lentzea sp. NPDC051838]|uniref:aminoglycoside phosphotransferase family protein n=1 Tax=Lentzea sp. NPDC051838 TaxID=3154849 RepID=UPI00342517F5